mgnify:CR=1 FL=1
MPLSKRSTASDKLGIYARVPAISDDQGSDGQALPLRQPSLLTAHLHDCIHAYNYRRRFKSCAASPPTNTSAYAGQANLGGSTQIRTTKCRDQTPSVAIGIQSCEVQTIDNSWSYIERMALFQREIHKRFDRF